MKDNLLVAQHQAGHAVAAVMRGFSGALDRVTVRATPACSWVRRTRCRAWDRSFIIYAGMWAEARAQWPLAELEGRDSNGCTFDDYVIAALLRHADGDFSERVFAAHPAERFFADSSRKNAERAGVPFEECEQKWSRELEPVWPVVEHVAGQLQAGSMPGSDLAKLVYAVRHETDR